MSEHHKFEKDEMVKVGVLWEKTSARGTHYMQGPWNDAQILILPNDGRGQGSKAPQWNIYITPWKGSRKRLKTPPPVEKKKARHPDDIKEPDYGRKPF